MNLFVLDRSPETAAAYNCDTHVCKIILEAAQVLTLAHHALNRPFPEHAPQKLIAGMYAPKSSLNHPVTKWVRSDCRNYQWTSKHAMALCSEYSRRYFKIHATQEIIEWLKENHPFAEESSGEPTSFCQAIPDEYKSENAVHSYRNYYIHSKGHLLKYRLGNKPDWL